MDSLSIYALKALRKLYARLFSPEMLAKPERITDAEVIAQLIYDGLVSEEPCMVARFGSTELHVMTNYLGVHKKEKKIWSYIQGKECDWWWNRVYIEQMQEFSGFFPSTSANIERFCELMIQDIPLVDILGSWRPGERFFEKELQHAHRVELELLNPYFSATPWTLALENKKVLVVHPFAASIGSQYQKRTLLFEDQRILPAFELKTIKAVQSLGGGNRYSFADWFEALDFMKSEIDKTDYDICLLGCGAYGFPLAAHVKRAGKKAVHLGGSLQLLFGIKGNRWEDPNYNKQYNYAKLMNEHWVKPKEEEKSQNAQTVENACYW
jgi:hypothetical protein